jgi:hypothetical protein
MQSSAAHEKSPNYRKIPLILAHNELPVCAVSCLEELG